METSKIQLNMLRVLDTLKGSMDNQSMNLIAGRIAAICADKGNEDRRVSEAIITLCDAIARVWNYRGFEEGLKKGRSLCATQPPIIELIDMRDKGNEGIQI